MDKTQIEQNQLVDRYVQHRLQGDELEAFEVYMLENPEILDDIEYAKQMQRSLRDNIPRIFESGGNGSDQLARPGGWQMRSYAVAATLLLAISAVFLVRVQDQVTQLEQELLTASGPTPLGNEITLEASRGGGDIVIEREPGTTILMHINVGTPISESYQLEIAGNELDYSVVLAGLQPDSDGYLAVIVNDMADGQYILTFESEQSPAASGDVEFEIVRPRK